MITPRKYLRREKLKKALGQAIITTRQVLDSATASIYPEEDQNALEIVPVRVTLPHLRRPFEGYRIVQISDIHMDSETPTDYLPQIAEIVNQQEPDLVVVTGDFVTVNSALHADALIEGLSQLAPRDATLAVLGNHDHYPWSDSDVIRWMIHESGMIELSNAVHTVRRGDAVLHVAGVDDVTSRHENLEFVLQELPDEGPAILLCHAPDFADISGATGRFDMQISGHSHGGQISLPLIGPPIFPRNGRKYTAGMYMVQGMLVYTNRGIGYGHPRIRFNCRPEITVFTLRSNLD